MTSSQTVPDLVIAAQANAKTIQDRISEILKDVGNQHASDAQDLRDATAALEVLAVDIFTVFEARMQHHFKRGPFSRKLIAQLLSADENDLAERIRQYYLAVNVLKHGKGASYRELLSGPATLFTVHQSEDASTDDAAGSNGLIDVTAPNFFDGLATTILEAYQFLESK